MISIEFLFTILNIVLFFIGISTKAPILSSIWILTCHSCPTYKSNITILLAPFADCLKNMRKRFPALCQRIFHMRWNLIELLAANQSAVHSVSRLPTTAKSILVREPSKQSTSRCRTIPRSKSAPVTAKDSCAIMDRQPSLMIPHYWKNN